MYKRQALFFFAPALFAHSGIEILSRGYYATGDTRTPVAFAVAAMLINLVLSALLIDSLELQGLALALSIATVLEFVLLFIGLRQRIPMLMEDHLLRGLWCMGLATVAMAIAVAASVVGLVEGAGLDPDSTFDALLILIVGGTTGGLTYFGAAHLLGLDEPAILLRRVSGMLGRGVRRAT